MEAFGRGLVSEPYLSTVVIGAGLIGACGSEAQKQALLPKVADGSLYLAFAHSERAARFDLAEVATTAWKTPDGWRLDGRKTAVLDGNAAGQIIVSAQVADDNGVGELGLFLVPAEAAGLDQARFPATRRRARMQPRTSRRPRGRRRPARRRQRCAACYRGRGRPRNGRTRRGSRRHHADAAGSDARIHQNSKTVRPAAVRQSGDPPSARRHGDELRRGPLDGAARRADGRCRTGRARARRLGRQGQDRQMRALRRRTIRAAAWRDGRHRGARHRFLLQAAARLRHACSAAAPIIIAVTPPSAAGPQ